MHDYRGLIDKRGGGYALAWVKAENLEEAKYLLRCIYGKYNVDLVREMRYLEIYRAEVFLLDDTFVPTAVCAEDRADARRTLNTLYGKGNFRLLSN